ncbi:MAG: hypothetical protein Q9225_005714 [Loekoesia sp. 1 TL-2023]
MDINEKDQVRKKYPSRQKGLTRVRKAGSRNKQQASQHAGANPRQQPRHRQRLRQQSQHSPQSPRFKKNIWIHNLYRRNDPDDQDKTLDLLDAALPESGEHIVVGGYTTHNLCAPYKYLRRHLIWIALLEHFLDTDNTEAAENRPWLDRISLQIIRIRLEEVEVLKERETITYITNDGATDQLLDPFAQTITSRRAIPSSQPSHLATSFPNSTPPFATSDAPLSSSLLSPAPRGSQPRSIPFRRNERSPKRGKFHDARGRATSDDAQSSKPRNEMARSQFALAEADQDVESKDTQIHEESLSHTTNDMAAGKNITEGLTTEKEVAKSPKTRGEPDQTTHECAG